MAEPSPRIDANGRLVQLGVAARHDLWVTPSRLYCDLSCTGPEPHVLEYRAIDVNPNK